MPVRPPREGGGVFLMKVAIAGRGVKLSDRRCRGLPGARLFGGRRLRLGTRSLAEAARGLEAGVVGERSHLLPHVAFDVAERDAGREILREGGGGQEEQEDAPASGDACRWLCFYCAKIKRAADFDQGRVQRAVCRKNCVVERVLLFILDHSIPITNGHLDLIQRGSGCLTG